jgi:hypothetical protein
MKVFIEFYRTRDQDDAHAVVGRVAREVADAEAAIRLARSLVLTLAMPQVPDQVRICDESGSEIFSGTPS